MATDKYDLHTIDYSVQGWDAILTTDMEKLDDVIHSRIIATAGEAIAEFDAVFLAADGKYDQALADGAQQPAVGLALESAVLNDVIRIQRLGPITNVGWAWATVGAPVYLSDAVLGGLTDVEPAANSQVMGFVLSATSIFIWPDLVGGVGAAPGAHKDTHDPEDGADPLDCAAASEIVGVQAAAEGSAHFFARSDHDHQVQHGIADNHIVTMDDADAQNGDHVRLTANGLEGRSPAEALGDLNEAAPRILGEHDLKIDSLLSADGKYSGITCDGILGATLAFGDLVYLNTTDQRWELADADAEATAGDVMLALVLVAGNDGDTRLLLLQGFIRENDWNFTSYGQALFVGLTAGDMVQDVSTYTTGDIVRVVGYASTFADQIYFNPSGTWLEIA